MPAEPPFLFQRPPPGVPSLFQSACHCGTLPEAVCWWLDVYEDMTPKQRRSFLGTMLRGDDTCAGFARELMDGFRKDVTRESVAPDLTREACIGALATFLEGEYSMLADPAIRDSPDMAPGTPTWPGHMQPFATLASSLWPRCVIMS